MDKKTVLERFQDIKELEVADGLGTVADVLPYFCKNVDEALLRLEVIDNTLAICKKANEQKYVYIKESYGIIKEDFLDDLDYEFFNNRLYVCSRGMYYDFPLKDYGNWWALTKEELENE